MRAGAENDPGNDFADDPRLVQPYKQIAKQVC
jgi:hypothetical protein